ncbi:DeoR/GlpR family DNA-binding transcription regulator [Roseobacter sp. A03A-229]
MEDALDAPLPKRHRRILEIIAQDRSAEVATLSEALGVSAVTIRSDLDILDRRMLLRRVRGGAVAVESARFERPVDLPGRNFTDEKARIGAAAAAKVRDGETIILDAGTTTLAMAMALPEGLTDVMVITSSLDIAIELEEHSGITVVVTGGTLKKSGRNKRSRSLIPPLAGLLLESLNADCAYLCCAGVDASRGFTNAHPEEAEVKRAMIAAARRSVMLADHGKIGHVAGARIAPIRDIAALITDRGAPAADIAALEAASVTVTRA